MADIAHVFGSDLAIGPTGDLVTCAADAWTQQRILRRLLTSIGGYIWQLRYGAGLSSLVGSPVNVQQIRGIIRHQLLLESSVAASPAPVVEIQTEPGGNVFAIVKYHNSTTSTTVSLTIPG